MTRLLIALCCAALLAAAACSGGDSPTSPSGTGATITDTVTASGNGGGKGNGDKGNADKGGEDKGNGDKGNGDKGNGDKGGEDKGGVESGRGGNSGGNGGATVDDRLTSSPVGIKKFTNGQHADRAPGPSIPIDNPVTWTYLITNQGPVTFTSLSVTDDRGVAVACPRTLPAPGASVTCTGSGTAVAGQYRNIGTVTVTANGNQYTASDASFYFGRDDDAPDDGLKVQLCHRTGNGSFHMIEVSVNAEPAHRAHGDGKVGEAVPGSPDRVFTASCGVE